VAEAWVANASPIIVLAKAGYLDLLKNLPHELLIPEIVANEILAGPESDPARQALEAGWGTRIPSEPFPEDLLEWGLGPGETSVLAAARLRPKSHAILDDGAARSCAKTFGIPLLGTLGVILRAKIRGQIPIASEVIRAVHAAGLHLDERTIRSALAGIGEEW
jgi:predicted nucleic acid-binding protein